MQGCRNLFSCGTQLRSDRQKVDQIRGEMHLFNEFDGMFEQRFSPSEHLQLVWRSYAPDDVNSKI